MIQDFEANYETLEDINRLFNQHHEDMNALYQHLKRMVEDLHQLGWVGRGSDEFYTEMSEDVFPKFRRLCEALDLSSSVVKRVQSVIAEAEEDALHCFET